MSEQKVQLDKIELVQSRAHLSTELIDEYAQEMREGAVFPAIDVVAEDGRFWCWDGCHRTLAARQAGLAELLANVVEGTRRDAVLQAAGANPIHGLRRSNEDKRRAVQFLLDDPEWAQWSNREIARRCNVSDVFVGKMRAQDVQLQTLAVERVYERSGQTQTMDVANIGRTERQSLLDQVLDQAEKQLEITSDLSFYVSANRRVFRDLGHGPVCIGAARTRFPQFCPRSADPPTGNHCQGCIDHIITDRGTYLCGHPDYQLEDGIHFCHNCGRELSPYGQAHGWTRCDGIHCKNERNKYALTDPDVLYPPAPHTLVPQSSGLSDPDDETATEAELIAGEDDGTALAKAVFDDDYEIEPDEPEAIQCSVCGKTMQYIGPTPPPPDERVCVDCALDANKSRERARQERLARATGSLARAIRNDNASAWRMIGGMIMPVFHGIDVDAMRKLIARKILDTVIGYSRVYSETVVKKFFDLNNVTLDQSLADLRARLVELREWIVAQPALTDAQAKGNRANLAGLREATVELMRFGCISLDEYETFGNETVAVGKMVDEKRREAKNTDGL
jgi:hypothetical protein